MKQATQCNCFEAREPSPAAGLRDAVSGAFAARIESPLLEARCIDVQPPARPSARKRLWEIPQQHHCVLLGAAFDARELRRLFQRAGYSDWREADDYALHSSAVCYARAANAFSRLAQRILEERCAAGVSRFKAARNATELLALWREAARDGDPVPAYWAALTHPACDAEADEMLAHEMHMVAHFAFSERRAAARRIAELEARGAHLEGVVTRSAKQCAALRQEAARLRAETLQAQREARERFESECAARVELEGWRNGGEAQGWKTRIALLEKMREAERAAAEGLQRELRSARRRIEWLEAQERPTAGTPAATPASPAAAVVPASAQPPDLDSVRVLCVGGKLGLVAQYRAEVEKARAGFAYHDGGIEDHVGRLPAMLGAADAVVCLAGDVSHCAYHLVKEYCKRRGKPCALVKTSGVSALARGLAQVATVRYVPSAN